MANFLQDDKQLSQRPRLQATCVALHEMALQLGQEAKLPTMVELCNQLGVSVQTLSDAVRELEKRGILNSVRGVGIYVTSRRDRPISGNVGFLTPVDMDPSRDISYWGLVLAGMRAAAQQRKRHLLLIDDGAEFDRWEKIDGALLCDTRDPRDPEIPMSKPPRGFPCISILNELPSITSVTSDEFEGAYRLTKHLLKQGHRRIAYLATLESGLWQLEQRKEGYLKALREAGVQVDPRWMRELRRRNEWDSYSWYELGGEFYTHQWLQDDWEQLGCTALIAQNDEVARSSMAAFQSAGWEVPRDVSVAGFDSLNSTFPQLTTVGVPLFEIGHTAMQLLLDWLDDPQRTPQSIRLPVSLIEGQTTTRPSRANRKQALVAVQS